LPTGELLICMKETNIRKICEFTGKEFFVDYKHRNQRFINKQAMYDWRKGHNRETVLCLNCKTQFERYKRILHPRTGKLTQYCSNTCNRTSLEKKDKLRIWIKTNNPMNNIESVSKISKTKFEKYGDSKYNNIEKNKQTCIDRYGVSCVFDRPDVIKSNGKRISKFQEKIYTNIKKLYPDAKLEYYLTDVCISVDIYIPSINKIIECYGDYWHCNPKKYAPDFYNKSIHKNAKEIWEKDTKRKNILEMSGYVVDIIWENKGIKS